MNTLMNNNIIKRTKELFQTMFKLEVNSGTPYAVDPDTDIGWDLSGVISVAGSLCGLVAIRYHKKTAELMLEHARLLNPDVDFNSNLLRDMVGEVSNTIAGNVLSEAGIDELMLSIPIAIQGKGHTISWPRNTEITAVPFAIKSEIFVVQIGLK